MVFKNGDLVTVTPPDDYGNSPGFSIRMKNFLEDVGFKIKLSGIRDEGRGWWVSSTDNGVWTWSEAWMEKVNKFKGNK